MIQKRFISPLTDFGFKRIFGNKDILLAFLNDLFEGEVQFTDLVYSDKEIKGDTEVGKTVIYDIHCTTSSGEKIIVEMQNEFTLGFRDRMVYYIARDVAKQGEAGKGWDYDRLKAVYSIIFTNFELFESDSRQESFLRHDVKLVDTATSKPFTDKILMVCLQIPLTIEEPLQVETKLDTWMYNLKNMETMQQLTNTEDMPIFKRLEQVAEYHQLSPEDREAYDISYKHYLDAYNLELSRKKRMEMAMEQGLQKGMEQGLQKGMEQGLQKGMEQGLQKGMEQGLQKGMEQGLQKGMEQGLQKGIEQGLQQGIERGVERGRAEGERTKQFEIARTLKSLGIDTATIVKGTGLSVEEIESL